MRVTRVSQRGAIEKLMPNKYGLNRQMDVLTDAEISAEIRYLDPSLEDELGGNEDSAVVLTCISMLLLMIFVAFIFLSRRLH